MPAPAQPAQDTLDLSVLAPAHNEEDNIGPLVERVSQALGPLAASEGVTWEMIVVDDGSTDRTRARLMDLTRSRPWLRVIEMRDPPPGAGMGQSAAFHAGFRAARGRFVATLDADLQNDPADLPRLWLLLHEHEADMVQGDRTVARADGVHRKAGAAVGRAFRRMILGDTIRDTGCSLRILRREAALRLPLEFRGAHRFIPACVRRLGYTVIETPVAHHARTAGESKYGMGIVQRAIPGLMDCFAMRWMFSRMRSTRAIEITPSAHASGRDDGADRADALERREGRSS
ncbi:MAG: glycosyltransferase family 2 protein [Phycisphaerales bacterium]|nr:MAG: glycosyltransferase family 2 protein [Phycisphaerales bacterium]